MLNRWSTARLPSVSTLQPRPYQREAVEALLAAFDAGQRRPAVVLPTGTGKTVTFSHLIERLHERGNPGRILVLAHREELIEQAADKIRSLVPRLRVGIVKAHLNQVLADVVVASVQTLRNAARRAQLRHVGVVIVDECHHATADSYRTIMLEYGCYAEPGQPGAYAVGFTATMSRGDGARLGDVWQDIVYTRDTAWAIREGYLARVRGVRVQVPDLDLRRVKRMAGDYSDKALGAALEGSLAPQAVARAYTEHAAGRQGILFAPTVSSAEVMGDALAEAGYTVRLVHGAMSLTDRRAALDSFREGKTTVLASCMILTEGTDLPMAEVGLMARPTTIPALYTQMAGRVLRPYPGKVEALLLDVCGVTAKHALITPADLFGKELRELADTDVDDLLDLDAEQPEERASRGDQVLLDGQLESVEVDLFHGSASAWQRTAAGYWFLATAERFLAIVPGDNREHFDVLWMTRFARDAHSDWVARDLPTLTYAQSAAERAVTEAERAYTSRDAQRNARTATTKMLDYAARLGHLFEPGAKTGEVSRAIAYSEASRRIDPVQLARADAWARMLTNPWSR